MDRRAGTDFPLCRIAALPDEVVARRLGTTSNLSFEKQCDSRFEVARDALWVEEDRDARTLVTDGDAVDVGEALKI